MDIHQLNAFYHVANEKSFRKAAEILHVTQPAISTRIQHLEAELTVSLFERMGRTIELTSYGHMLLPYAEKILALAVDAVDSIHAAHEERHAKLSIGTTSRIVTYILPHILGRFHENHPDIQLSVSTGLTESILELMSEERIELAIMNSMTGHKHYTSIPLLKDSIVMIASPDHQLNDEFIRHGSIDFMQIQKQTVIINFSPAASYFRPIIELFKSHDITPSSYISVDNIEAIKRMTVHKLGISFLPKTAVQRELRERELVEIPFPHQEKLTRETYIMYKENPFPNPSIKKFIDIAKTFSPNPYI